MKVKYVVQWNLPSKEGGAVVCGLRSVPSPGRDGIAGYQCWVGGVDVGFEETIEAAMHHVQRWVAATIRDRLAAIQSEVYFGIDNLQILASVGLEHFAVTPTVLP